MRSLTVLMTVMLTVFLLAGCENRTAKKELTEAEKIEYLGKGKAVAAETFAVMSGKLVAALEAGGVANAVQYCNLAAMPLADSLSKQHQAVIRRTSLKIRNPLNEPSDWERKALLEFEKKDQAGEELQPYVQMLDGGRVAFAAPIRVMTLCTKCHGKEGETMTAEDAQAIKSLYPDDRATGYAEGDLRGMWSIVFRKES